MQINQHTRLAMGFFRVRITMWGWPLSVSRPQHKYFSPSMQILPPKPPPKPTNTQTNPINTPFHSDHPIQPPPTLVAQISQQPHKIFLRSSLQAKPTAIIPASAGRTNTTCSSTQSPHPYIQHCSLLHKHSQASSFESLSSSHTTQGNQHSKPLISRIRRNHSATTTNN